MLKKFSGSILYILILLLVLSLFLDRHESLEKIEVAIQDTMFKIRGTKSVSQDIVVVGIDDRTLETMGKWPWNRDKTAQLVNAISAQKPKTIALDMTFSPNEYQKAAGYNDSLAKAITRAGNVIIGYHYSQGDVSQGVILPDGLANCVYKAIDDQSALSQYPPLVASRIFPPDSLLANSATMLGFINVNIDEDRKVRWQPLVVGYRGEFFPSLQVAAAADYLDIEPAKLGLRVGKGITIGSKNIPTDSRGLMNINYNGPANTFKFYSANDFLNNSVSAGELRDKLVIVGYNGRGSTDIYSTSISGTLSGMELDANILENIIDNNALKNASNRVSISFILLIAIGILSALVLPKVTLLSRVAILAGLLIALMGANYLLFTSFHLVIKTFYPALEIVFLLAAAPIIKTSNELRTNEENDEDDEEVDFESLLSSSQSILIADQTPIPQNSTPKYVHTIAADSPSPSRTETVYSSSETTAPSRASGQATITIMENPGTDHFGRYKILRPIGKGAMGMVYQGLDPAIDRPVALKTIRLDQVADSDEIEELRERLTREAKAAGKLSHPNIVTIYDVGEEGTTQYIAMEYLQGNTLENILKAGLDWDYRTISRVMIQACEALDYAHENGIVHRDIKPANIMVMDGNKIKVMDFGIARLDKSASMTQTGTALGTPNYISPEQLKGLPVDRRSDIFSLGVVFYEVLTREKPFKGDTISALIYSILHTEPVRPSELNLDIPRIFDKIIAKALVKDPDLRFQRAKDVADILRKLI
jgi:eukaryotic-like serine/threonine-protein kinase